MRGFSAILGEHVRARIDGFRKQVQYGANLGIPSVLVIYNNADALQMIGTSDDDFLTAMYGEYTIFLDRPNRKSSEIFRGSWNGGRLVRERVCESRSSLGSFANML